MQFEMNLSRGLNLPKTQGLQQEIQKQPQEEFKKHYSTWEKALTKTEKRSILHYSTTEHFHINALLRDSASVKNAHIFRTAELKNKAASISHAIRKAKIPFPIKVYRGLSREYLLPRNDQNWSGLVGKYLTDPGFMSTSLSKAHGLKFGNVLLEITLKTGDPAVYLSNVSVTPYEEEVLIDKGQTLRITNVRKYGGRVLLECELV